MHLKRAYWQYQRTLSEQDRKELEDATKTAEKEYGQEAVSEVIEATKEEVRKHNQRLTR